MRKIEKTYDNQESPEWRGELVELLSGVVYDYLRKEGFLRAEDKLSEKAKKAVQTARGVIDRWEVWEKEMKNNSCLPEDTNIY